MFHIRKDIEIQQVNTDQEIQLIFKKKRLVEWENHLNEKEKLLNEKEKLLRELYDELNSNKN
jgi:hypothetical protein